MNKFKSFLISILAFVYLLSPLAVSAANTHSLDLELGSGQYASIADASQTGLDLTDAMTLEMWVKPESFPGADNTFFVSKFVSGNDNACYQFRYDTQGGGTKLYGTVVSNPVADEVNVDQALSTGVWQHLALTWAGGLTKVFKFYYNGVQVGGDKAGSLISSINDCSAAFVVGARNAGLFYDGLIDEVRVWNVVRTAGEILANTSTELVGNESGLVAYYKFNDSYLDETANNNDLTATNSPVFSVDVPFVGAVAAAPIRRRPINSTEE